MACELRWTRHGDEALDALADAVRTARNVDALAPVTVVTPSPAVAVATRRALARHLGGTVGVGFHALGAVVEQLAAPRLAAAGAGVGAGVDRELVVAAVRVTLAGSPGAFAPIAAHRATWERVADAVAEVDLLDDAARGRVRADGRVPAEVVRVHGVVRRRLGPVGESAAVDLAVEVAAAGGPRVRALGAVVVHLPQRLSAAELGLLATLAGHVPVVVLAGATGDAAVDTALADHLAPLGALAPPAVGPAPVTDVISANDVDDEVRSAVRALLALADAGTPLHRMALVHPAGPPYARVAADVVAATGVPASGPSTRRLAQTAPGRVLLGLLDVEASGFGRQEVVDLWATGVVVDAAGNPVAAAVLDERSRRLGVIRGRARWHEALDADDAEVRAVIESAGDAEVPERHARRAEQNEAMRTALDRLEVLCEARPSRWADVAGWAGTVLDDLCGPVRRRSWPPAEVDADHAIRTVLGRLAALDDLEPVPSDAVVRATIRAALDQAAPRAGTAGGLLVTTVDAPPLVPLDAVVVVGLAEGHLPRVAGDDGLLGDELRRAVGLPVADDHQLQQRRALLAALASAGQHRIATYARHDQRSGRTLVPSRWLVDAVERAGHQRPDVEQLMAGREVPGVRLVRSHGAGLAAVAAGHAAPLHADEHALAALVAAGRLEEHPAAADPVLAAGAALLAGRRSSAFTRFDGNLGGEGIDISAEGALSPTSLETYAQCPRRWFFAHALQLRPTDRPEEIDRLSPRDRGSLAHRALERFYEEAIGADTVPPPGRAWPDGARARLRDIVEEESALIESRGITGHPRRWEHDRAEVHRVLQRVLTGDDRHRADLRATPVAVELTFGRAGQPPLAVDLGDGRTVLLAGQADRVDVGDGRVVVWDYKYADPTPYAVLQKPEADGGDPLGGGTKIQLVAYGMAAAGHDVVPAGDDVEVTAWYWFLRPSDTNKAIGYVVDAPLRDRFRRVLRVLADGIGSGRFPARPGEHQYHLGTFEHCAWCDFDAICPRDRDEEWSRVRDDPALAPLRALVEEGSSTVLDPPGPAEEVRS